MAGLGPPGPSARSAELRRLLTAPPLTTLPPHPGRFGNTSISLRPRFHHLARELRHQLPRSRSVLAGNRFVRFDRRTAFDLLTGKVYKHDLSFDFIEATESMRGEQHQTSCKPQSGIRDQVANHPGFVVEVEILYPPDISVRRGEFVTVESC